MKIEITLRPGVEEVSSFADITFEDKINLLGCAVFAQSGHTFRVAMPSRKSKDGKHFPVVSLAPSLAAQVTEAVTAAITARQEAQ